MNASSFFVFIERTQANGVVLMAGNVNFAEISQYEKGVYPFVELTSNGMTHSNELYGKAANTSVSPGLILNSTLTLLKLTGVPSRHRKLLSRHWMKTAERGLAIPLA